VNQGVIYLLHGSKLGVRLAVSLWTLRQHYSGPVCILTTDERADEIGQLLASDSRLNVMQHTIRVGDPTQRHWHYVLKTFVSQFMPFETSVFIDCDTIVRGSIDELFCLPTPQHIVVTQFCDWHTRGRIMSKRIRAWQATHAELIEPALAFGPAINTGVFSITRQTAVLERWSEVARAGQEHHMTDELAMQLLLPHYPNVVLGPQFNCSIKYGCPEDPDTRIIHFHGRKHIGIAGLRWLEHYHEAIDNNVADVCSWAPAGDRVLRNYIRGLNGALRP